jgi:tRNA pseudouridine55 synthase
MVLLLGEATKLSQVFLEKTKSYEVEFTLGVETDTLDRTGTVLRRVDPEALSDCTIERVNALAQKLQGEFEWPIPSYSAKKINGEKMYVMAREGRMEQLEVRPRKKMSFWGVGEVVKCGDPVFRVSLSCSAGSFIRTWGFDNEDKGREYLDGCTRTSLHQYGGGSSLDLLQEKRPDGTARGYLLGREASHQQRQH